MQTHRLTFGTLALLAALGLAAPSAAQVNITVVGTLGDLDGNADAGAGEAAVVQAAVACWANRLGTNRNFTLTIAGGALTGGTIGQGATSAVDGAGIPTAGRLTMDNDGTTTYFVDPTPLVSAEFPNPDANSQWRLLGGTNVDLFSVLTHEIGHALGWLCGGPAGCTGFTNPNYDGLMNPAPGSFVVSPTCVAPFPLAGQPQLAGCVRLVQGGGTPLNVSLRGDGVGTVNQVVNELSHPGVTGDLMIGFYTTGARETQSVADLNMFAHAYGDAVNFPLNVNAGTNILSECNATGGSNVTLNGGGTNDPEGNPSIFSWGCGGVALSGANTATPSGFFTLGPTVTCRLDASDLAACPPDADTMTVRVQDTTAPVVTCPSSVSVECTQIGGSPDTNPTIAGFLAGPTATDVCDASLTISDNAPAFFDVGVSTPVKFSTQDDSVNPAQCTATVDVVDTTAPTITCPANITVECSQFGGAPASDPAIAAFLGGANATDICDATLPISNSAPAFFGVGTTTPVGFSTQDDFANPADCSASVKIVDTTPPVIANVTATPNTLWPPNHRMVPVVIGVSVADVCDPSLDCHIVSVSSNEPVDGKGDGHTMPDWMVTGPLTVDVRAERSGGGSGRIYTIGVQCTDGSANSTLGSVQVGVAHDQR